MMIQADIETALVEGMKKAATSKDYPEEYHLENGLYTNRCIKCDSNFKGYKRRCVCKECNMNKSGSTEG